MDRYDLIEQIENAIKNAHDSRINIYPVLVEVLSIADLKEILNFIKGLE